MIAHIFLTTEKQLRNIWWVAIFLLMLAAFLFPLIILADHYSFEITMAHQAVLILIVSVICQLFTRKSLSNLTGRISYKWFKEFFWGSVIGAVLMILPAMLLTVFGYLNWQANAFSHSTILSGLTLFLAVAIGEEFLFRGFMFQRLVQSLGPWPAQLIIAGLFLLTHINNPGMIGVIRIIASINIFIASIMFGLAFLKTKSLAMPLGLHFMANFMQGTILGFGVSGGKDPSLLKPLFNKAPLWLSGGDFGIEASILGLCFVIVVTVSPYFWNPSKDKNVIR
ncbi:MAG: hypothetical protein JWM28_817 [Chitinophagaceae bacterium]|nr:hypothetical protein [Chitinophagaceae bacterium]